MSEEREENPYRLRYTNSIFLVARDRANKQVLLGGLGGMGVGQMWVAEERAGQTFPRPESFENWETAPERSSK